MNNLLTSIEKELRNFNASVTCPVCGESQSFKLDSLSKIHLGTKSSFTATGGMPMVQCKHCKEAGKTTLISLNEHLYNKIARVVIRAIEEQPAKYIDAKDSETTICESE